MPLQRNGRSFCQAQPFTIRLDRPGFIALPLEVVEQGAAQQFADGALVLPGHDVSTAKTRVAVKDDGFALAISTGGRDAEYRQSGGVEPETGIRPLAMGETSADSGEGSDRESAEGEDAEGEDAEDADDEDDEDEDEDEDGDDDEDEDEDEDD